MSSYYVELRHEFKDGYLYLYIDNYGMEYEEDPDPFGSPYYHVPSLAFCRLTYRIPEAEYGRFKERMFKYNNEPCRPITEEELDSILVKTVSVANPWLPLRYMCEPCGIPLEYLGSEDVTWEQKKAMDAEREAEDK